MFKGVILKAMHKFGYQLLRGLEALFSTSTDILQGFYSQLSYSKNQKHF